MSKTKSIAKMDQVNAQVLRDVIMTISQLEAKLKVYNCNLKAYNVVKAVLIASPAQAATIPNFYVYQAKILANTDFPRRVAILADAFRAITQLEAKIKTLNTLIKGYHTAKSVLMVSPAVTAVQQRSPPKDAVKARGAWPKSSRHLVGRYGPY